MPTLLKNYFYDFFVVRNFLHLNKIFMNIFWLFINNKIHKIINLKTRFINVFGKFIHIILFKIYIFTNCMLPDTCVTVFINYFS